MSIDYDALDETQFAKSCFCISYSAVEVVMYIASGSSRGRGKNETQAFIDILGKLGAV